MGSFGRSRIVASPMHVVANEINEWLSRYQAAGERGILVNDYSWIKRIETRLHSDSIYVEASDNEGRFHTCYASFYCTPSSSNLFTNVNGTSCNEQDPKRTLVDVFSQLESLETKGPIKMRERVREAMFYGQEAPPYMTNEQKDIDRYLDYKRAMGAGSQRVPLTPEDLNMTPFEFMQYIAQKRRLLGEDQF